MNSPVSSVLLLTSYHSTMSDSGFVLFCFFKAGSKDAALCEPVSNLFSYSPDGATVLVFMFSILL